MRCSECRTNLPALIEGDLSGSDLREIEEHLEVCADCRRERSLPSKSVQAIKSLEPVRAPRDMGHHLRRRLMAESRPPVWRHRGWMAVAACLALVLVSWPWWLSLPLRTHMLATDTDADDGMGLLGITRESTVAPDMAPAPDVPMAYLWIYAGLKVDELEPALSEISAFVLESGGWVDRGLPAPDDGFNLTVVVPDDRLYSILRRLDELGSLQWEELRGEGLEEQLLAVEELVGILEGIVDEERARDPRGEDLIALVEKLADARGRLERVIQARSEVRIEINLGTD